MKTLRLFSWLVLCGAVSLSVHAERVEIVWPTINPAWLEGKPKEDYVQPAASGRTESALFGCTRTGGRRFHEGIDLKPIRRDRQGEALDPVFSVMAGRVLYANRTPWHSSYGNYVVIEHTDVAPPVMSLYAHLSSIEDSIREGARVAAGERIGIMGRSAGGYTIPRWRAHVHFELGFWLSEDFQDWYDRQGHETPNRHGLMSGFNIVGFDALDFYNRFRSRQVRNFTDYFAQEPVAFTLRVASETVPDFIERYPQFLEGDLPAGGVAGWEIDFSWYGLPKRWRPLHGEGVSGDDRVEIVSFDAEIVGANTCRASVQLRGGEPRIGSHTERTLQLLFGFRD